MDANKICNMLQKLEVDPSQVETLEWLNEIRRACIEDDKSGMLTLAQAGLTDVPDLGDLLGSAAAWIHLGMAFALNQKFEKAEKACKVAKLCYSREPDPSKTLGEGIVDYGIGMIYEYRGASLEKSAMHIKANMVGHYEHSEALYQIAIQRHAAAGDKKMTQTLQQLCKQIQARSERHMDIQWYSKLMKRLDTDLLEGEIRDCLDRSTLACERGQFPEMHELAKDCLQLAHRCSNPIATALALIHISIALASSGNYAEATSACQKARRIFHRNPSWRQRQSEAAAVEALGLIHQDHSNSLVTRKDNLYAEARNHYRDALDKLENAKRLYTMAGQPEKATQVTALCAEIERRALKSNR